MQETTAQESLARELPFTVALSDVEQGVKQELQRVARTAKVQGFRPGKAPLHVIERSHGASVRYDVLNKKVGEAFEAALQASGLRMAGAPTVDSAESKVEGQLSFVAKFEVFPTISLPDFSAIETTRIITEVGQAEVDSTVEILRKQRTTYTQVERVAQNEDRVTLDFVGTIDGVEFAGGKAENFPFVLGQGRMLPEFEAATLGLKAGESKAFPLAFPEDYHGADVAGKTAEFTITIKSVEEPVLPAVDAEFAKSLGQAEGNVEALLADIRSNIEREAKSRALNQTKAKAFEALLAQVDFPVPTVLVNDEIAQRTAQAREELTARGMPNAADFPIPEDTFRPEAERRVRLGLLVGEIVAQEKLSPSMDQVRARIEQLAQNYEKPQEVVAYYLSNAQERQHIENLVLEDNVVDFILSKAKVTETTVPFKEIMGQV